MRVIRTASLKPKAVRILSEDFTDQKLTDAVGNVYVRHDHSEYGEHEHEHDHEHEDSHEHAHEHFHGDKANLVITTLGLVIHSISDGIALGST